LARFVVRLSRLAQVAVACALAGGAAWLLAERKDLGWLALPGRILLLGGFGLYVIARVKMVRDAHR
jgi:EamA domain-containing membrane protein RarD